MDVSRLDYRADAKIPLTETILLEVGFFNPMLYVIHYLTFLNREQSSQFSNNASFLKDRICRFISQDSLIIAIGGPR